MKQHIITGALLLALAACGAETDAPVDPYADLAEDTILVRFEANPEIEDGQCNPNVHYAMRTTEETILLNVNFEVVDQGITGSGLAIFDEEKTGVARNTGELNMFDPYPMPCSDLSIRVSDLTCRLEDQDSGELCPNPVYEGTEIFASFRGLPTY
ncbi:MAG: hypothetical protein AAFZ74_10820 [Pseudomonadota bacterium]